MNTILQTALDLTELSRAMQIAREAVLGGTDWIEAGTPLIKSEGMNAVRELAKEFPNHIIIADLKTSDTGGLEVEMAAKAGADVVCILASADDAVIADALRGASLYGVELMADMMNVADVAGRARQLADMGVHIINAHVGIDQQMEGKNPLDILSEISGLGVKVAAAGGLNAETAAAAAAAGADIVGAEDIIAKIQTQNFLDFDVVITTPDMMGQLGRVARILGPKGLMPNPKTGTVTDDTAKAVRKFATQMDASYTPRLIAIPTTSGTGSEVTSFSVISESETELCGLKIEGVGFTAHLYMSGIPFVIPPLIPPAPFLDGLPSSFIGSLCSEPFMDAARNPSPNSMARTPGIANIACARFDSTLSQNGSP